jgi:hypothetical protein
MEGAFGGRFGDAPALTRFLAEPVYRLSSRPGAKLRVVK